MKKLNNNQKLLDKLNAQFAEELGFDVMLRKTTDYLMKVIGMRGQCAILKESESVFLRLCSFLRFAKRVYPRCKRKKSR